MKALRKTFSKRISASATNLPQRETYQPNTKVTVDGDEFDDPASALLHPDAHADGGLGCNNRAELDAQRGVVADLVKQLLRQVLSGRLNLINISLPVRLFEPRSYLEKLADVWVTTRFLHRAAAAHDPVERLKLVAAFFVSGIHLAFAAWRKPFNPILGETWQATLPDETAIYMEQISHHPPVSAFEMVSPPGLGQGWKFSGLSQPDVQAKPQHNVIRTTAKGYRCVLFADGGSVRIIYPAYLLHGLIYGSTAGPRGELQGRAEFVDEVNRLVAEVTFGKLTDADAAAAAATASAGAGVGAGGLSTSKAGGTGPMAATLAAGAGIGGVCAGGWDGACMGYAARTKSRDSQQLAGSISGAADGGVHAILNGESETCTLAAPAAAAGGGRGRRRWSRGSVSANEEVVGAAAASPSTELVALLRRTDAFSCTILRVLGPVQEGDAVAKAMEGQLQSPGALSRSKHQLTTSSSSSIASGLVSSTSNASARGGATLLARGAGNWLSHLDWDGRRYWTLCEEDYPSWRPVPDPLHSDSSTREDLQALKAGDLALAQRQKERLEQQQRYDRKLRQEGLEAAAKHRR